MNSTLTQKVFVREVFNVRKTDNNCKTCSILNCQQQHITINFALKTHKKARHMTGASAIFVFLSDWRFQIRCIGKIVRVKSVRTAKAL